MTEMINIHQAKTQLSRLLEQVQSGEDIIIAKAGNPVARLVPYSHFKRKITAPGAMKGQIWIANDFEDPINDSFDCLKDS